MSTLVCMKVCLKKIYINFMRTLFILLSTEEPIMRTSTASCIHLCTANSSQKSQNICLTTLTLQKDSDHTIH